MPDQAMTIEQQDWLRFLTSVSEMFTGTDQLPSWIELVDVQFFDVTRPTVKAWKLKESGMYDLINFEADLSLPRKGYQCDWPPLIGKIGS